MTRELNIAVEKMVYTVEAIEPITKDEAQEYIHLFRDEGKYSPEELASEWNQFTELFKTI